MFVIGTSRHPDTLKQCPLSGQADIVRTDRNVLLTQSGHERVRFCRDTRPALRPATLTKEILGLGVASGEAARISDSFGWAHDVAIWGAR
jgi:hypothetical protein